MSWLARYCVWGSLALLLMTGPSRAQPSACPGTRHAVVIGIDAYRNGVSRLRGARKDAERMAKALAAQGFKVTTLLDGQATRDRLRQTLGDQLLQTKPEDQVLIYFAGHGQTIGDGAPMGYLVPVDGDADRILTTGLSMAELVGWMNAYPARQRLFIADACYSGLALPSARRIRPDEPQVAHCPAMDLPVTAAIVAGRAGDRAFESGAGGVFTQTLLKVLAGQTTADPNGDGWISHGALGGYLTEVVAGEAKARFGVEQVPQVAARGDGRFMLRAGQPKRPPSPPVTPSTTSPRGTPALPSGTGTAAGLEAHFGRLAATLGPGSRSPAGAPATRAAPRVVTKGLPIPAYLSVNGDTKGFHVFVDGKAVGRVPLLKHPITPGVHRISAGASNTMTVEFKADQEVKLSYRLRRHRLQYAIPKLRKPKTR